MPTYLAWNQVYLKLCLCCPLAGFSPAPSETDCSRSLCIIFLVFHVCSHKYLVIFMVSHWVSEVISHSLPSVWIKHQCPLALSNLMSLWAIFSPPASQYLTFFLPVLCLFLPYSVNQAIIMHIAPLLLDLLSFAVLHRPALGQMPEVKCLLDLDAFLLSCPSRVFHSTVSSSFQLWSVPPLLSKKVPPS